MNKSVLFWIIALMLVALAGCFLLQTPDKQGQGQGNASKTSDSVEEFRIYGDPDSFFRTISRSDNFSIVMDITGLNPEETQAVIACGIGVARSWGEIGKNVSLMSNYIVYGNECIRGIPGANDTETIEYRKCEAIFNSTPYVYITYGHPASYFLNWSWGIIVDQEYVRKSECGFKISEQQ
ncbi:MAG: hypothetical protein QW112_00170 [Candidatus Micrarchaeia archaeon]